ncbi:MAG: Fur family transcriptional regulator [Actinomycetota bacterium]|nr:Fur family transcriptional regulator [Actinomycetota bacterium]
MTTAATAEGSSRDTFIGALRSAGLRTTGPRLATLGALQLRPHADTDTVIRHVRAELGAVSAQAVYNVLATLVQAELVRRIEPAGSSALYELRVGDNHHHIVCRLCGAVADVDCAVGYRPCLTPSETHGYVLDEAEVTYWGFCPSCRRRKDTGAPGELTDNQEDNRGGKDD